MQNTPLGPRNLQTTPFFENYSNYPRKKTKIIQTTLHKVIIIQLECRPIVRRSATGITTAQNPLHNEAYYSIKNDKLL